MKRCPACGETKPHAAFYRHARRKDGLQSECAACQNAGRARRPRRGSRPPAGAKKRCAMCGEIKVRAVDFWQAARGETLPYCKPCAAARKADPAQRAREATHALQRRRAHPERVREANRNRKAARRGQFVEYVDSLILLERDDGVCGICGEDVDPLRYEIDHVVPLSRGGEHSYANTEPAHPRCNRAKGSQLLEAV